MRYSEARAKCILGLMIADEYGEPDVRQAYARRVKEAHPDTGKQRGVSIRELQEARDLLLGVLESQKYACKLCAGVGKVRSGMAWRDCSACGGKGETK